MKNTVKENEQQISIMFDSLVELMESECPSKSGFNIRNYNELIQGTVGMNIRDWYGPTCKTSKDVIEKALLGDAVLYNDHLKNKIPQLGDMKESHGTDQNIKAIKRRKVRDSQGDELDIHRVYQGQLDKAWSRTERIEVAQKFHLVTLVLDYGGNSNVSATDSLWSTAVLVRLAEELERAGKSVQIIATFIGGDSSPVHRKRLSSSLLIKRYNESLSMERLAAMSHVGAFRVFGFLGIYYQKSKVNYHLGHDLGVDKNSLPLHIEEEEKMGHMRPVIIKSTTSLHGAKQQLANAYAQMLEFSN